MPADAQQLYQEVRNFYQRQRREMRQYTLDHLASVYGLKKTLGPSAYRQYMRANNRAELDAIDMDALGSEADKLKDAAGHVLAWTEVKGPYFPLRRFGDYVVEGVKISVVG